MNKLSESQNLFLYICLWIVMLLILYGFAKACQEKKKNVLKILLYTIVTLYMICALILGAYLNGIIESNSIVPSLPALITLIIVKAPFQPILCLFDKDQC